MRVKVWILVMALLASACFAASSWATEPLDDVPPDHWAYRTFDYFNSHEYLIGYPSDYFDGTQTFNRYELSLALANVMDLWSNSETWNGSEADLLLIEILRSEYDEELKHLSRIFAGPSRTYYARDVMVAHHPMQFSYYLENYWFHYPVIYNDKRECYCFAPFIDYDYTSQTSSLVEMPRIGMIYFFNGDFQITAADDIDEILPTSDWTEVDTETYFRDLDIFGDLPLLPCLDGWVGDFLGE